LLIYRAENRTWIFLEVITDESTGLPPHRNHEEGRLGVIEMRAFEPQDWYAICRIHDRARPDELEGSCNPRAFVPIEQDKEVEGLKRSRKFVAHNGDHILGFVGMDEKYLAWMYVDPDHYGQGIGRRLLQVVVAEIGSGAWTIVLEGNYRARQLYESEGFREAHRFESDNAGYPCTCLRMALTREESSPEHDRNGDKIQTA
jgi:GNAT superfamily N-acetyltransferase